MKIGKGNIIWGDCLEVMKTIPDNSIDLIVTSPPYNLRNSTGSSMNGNTKSGRWKNAKLKEGYNTHSDNMPHDEYVLWQRECLKEMLRIIPDNGAIFYNHKWRVQAGVLQDRADILEGFPVRQIIIWQRSGGFNFNDGYFVPTYEVIYMITKKNFKLRKQANAKGDIWKIKQERDNDHPAPFPLEIPQTIIESTNAQSVLDPFSGSGTTAIAAEKAGIAWVGIEKDGEYYWQSVQRVCKEVGIK